MDYEKDIQIDCDALDVEWLEQASLMLKYTRHLAKLRMELDQAKEELDVVKAELDKDIRTNPDDYDIDKITESVVENTIFLQKDYKLANKNIIQCKYEVDMAVGAVRAFEQRKDALENLVRLHGQQYFAGPRVPRDLSKEFEQHQRQQNVDKKITIKRRK
jgi:hypothetical protein